MVKDVKSGIVGWCDTYNYNNNIPMVKLVEKDDPLFLLSSISNNSCLLEDYNPPRDFLHKVHEGTLAEIVWECTELMFYEEEDEDQGGILLDDKKKKSSDIQGGGGGDELLLLSRGEPIQI